MPYGISHPYQLNDSNLKLHLSFNSTFGKQAVQSLAASDLVMHCLPMSYKKDARHIWFEKPKLQHTLVSVFAFDIYIHQKNAHARVYNELTTVVRLKCDMKLP